MSAPSEHLRTRSWVQSTSIGVDTCPESCVSETTGIRAIVTDPGNRRCERRQLDLPPASGSHRRPAELPLTGLSRFRWRAARACRCVRESAPSRMTISLVGRPCDTSSAQRIVLSAIRAGGGEDTLARHAERTWRVLSRRGRRRARRCPGLFSLTTSSRSGMSTNVALENVFDNLRTGPSEDRASMLIAPARVAYPAELGVWPRRADYRERESCSCLLNVCVCSSSTTSA